MIAFTFLGRVFMGTLCTTYCSVPCVVDERPKNMPRSKRPPYSPLRAYGSFDFQTCVTWTGSAIKYCTPYVPQVR